jgi:ion channel
MQLLTDAGNWVVVGTTIAIVLLCVGLHFEVLSNCGRFLRYVSHRRRPRVLVLILLILTTHVAEIWLFAFGYYGLVEIWALGSLRGAVGVTGLPDYAYFSAIVYATVGFGDLTPAGPIRFLAGVEALTGFVMITWSASLTFLEMQSDWHASRQ